MGHAESQLNEEIAAKIEEHAEKRVAIESLRNLVEQHTSRWKIANGVKRVVAELRSSKKPKDKTTIAVLVQPELSEYDTLESEVKKLDELINMSDPVQLLQEFQNAMQNGLLKGEPLIGMVITNALEHMGRNVDKFEKKEHYDDSTNNSRTLKRAKKELKNDPDALKKFSQGLIHSRFNLRTVSSLLKAQLEELYQKRLLPAFKKLSA